MSSSVARSIFFYTDSRVLGGAENAMFMLLESLDRGALASRRCCSRRRPGPSRCRAGGGARGAGAARRADAAGARRGAPRVPALARLLRRERPDVFHAHMSSPVACKWGLAAAVLARVPAVLGTVQVGAYEPPDRSAYWQLRGAGARGRPLPRGLAGRSPPSWSSGFGWPAEKVEVVYNAVDVERFGVAGAAGPARAARRRATRPLVLTPARLDAQKGHAGAAGGGAAVPEAVFVLAGEGPERGALEALAGRARGRRPGPLPRPPRGRPAAARRLRRLRPALALRGLLAGGAGGDGGRDARSSARRSAAPTS